MKKFLVLCMMLVLAAGVLAGCGNDAAKKDEGGKIVVGLDDNFPPMGFKDESNEIVSDIKEIILNDGQISKATFTLSPKASSTTNCMLALQSSIDGADELQQLIPFEVNISFTSEFDF